MSTFEEIKKHEELKNYVFTVIKKVENYLMGMLNYSQKQEITVFSQL